MKILLILLIVLELAYAQDLDDLLSEYTLNNDLSETTKLENAGSSIIYTRQDLEIMQARNLKDILKSLPFRRYTESRFGTPELLFRGDTSAFASSNVRVYINNQELSSANFGSGFGTLGDMNLDGIDHIEIYLNAPSYEFTSEPTYILIKLYTKTAQRDSGGKISLSLGSLGFNSEALSYGDEIDELSYFVSTYRDDDKREVYHSHNIPIKRDNESYGALASIYTDKHNLLLHVAKSTGDSSIGRSPLATYETSTHSDEDFFIGYDTSAIENFIFSTSLQFSNTQGHYNEAVGFESIRSPEYKYDGNSNILNAELKYKLKSQNNLLVLGSKYRHKSFNIESLKINNIEQEKHAYDAQSIYSAFVENTYNISSNNIINLAGHYSYADNNGGVKDESLIQWRISNTYLLDDFTFKTYLFHAESLVEPYLYTGYSVNASLKPTIVNAISEEMKFKYKNQELKFFIVYKLLDESVMQLPNGSFENMNEQIEVSSTYIEHKYSFDIYNKIVLNASYSKSETSTKVRTSYAAFIRSLNTVGKFDIFNEVIFNRNTSTNKNYYDYTAGVTYKYNEEVTLSLKGENIFNTGYEEMYFRVDPVTGTQETTLLISPVEQRFYINLEYLF